MGRRHTCTIHKHLTIESELGNGCDRCSRCNHSNACGKSISEFMDISRSLKTGFEVLPCPPSMHGSLDVHVYTFDGSFSRSAYSLSIISLETYAPTPIHGDWATSGGVPIVHNAGPWLPAEQLQTTNPIIWMNSIANFDLIEISYQVTYTITTP